MPTAPYPLLADIMNMTRARVNDMIVSLGGQTLTNNAPFTSPMVNVAWESLQQFLLGLGYKTLEESISLSLPAAGTMDPNVEASLSWTGFFDGVTNHPTLFLPENFIKPVKEGLEERQTLNNPPPNVLALNAMGPMDEIIGPLAHVPKGPLNIQWQWRGDAIVMLGSTTPTDVRVRYWSYLAKLDPTNVNQTVPIMRCEDALADLIAVEFSRGRGDMDVDKFLASAQQKAAIIGGDDNTDMRLQKASERGKMRDRYDQQQVQQ